MNLFANLFGFKRKEKPEIPRIELAEYGEPKYQFTHRFSLEEYREYNWVVSQPAIKQDKKIKKWGAVILGVITVFFLILAIKNFDLKDYLDDGRTFWTFLNYSSFTFNFVVFLMAGYLTYHLGTFYKYFDKRLEKATKEYYESSKYLKNDITLAVYENGVLEKAAVRDEFFPWERFNRCWDTENIVFIEFNLANQLFVAKHNFTENGVSIEEFMDFCNEHIEEAKRLAEEREALEEAEEEAEEEEYLKNEEEIARLEEENKNS